MALKIRLRRMGRKKAPTYRIVVAESSMPRDGRFVANLGHYNPRTDPVTLVVDRDRALSWIEKGAMPTDTTKSLLKQAGVFKPEAEYRAMMAAAAESVADTAKKAGSRASATASKAAKSAAGGAAKAASKAKEIAGDAVEAVKDVVEDVVDAVEDAVEDVREAVAGEDEDEEKAEASKAKGKKSAKAKADEGESVEAPTAEAETPAAEAADETPAEDKA